MCVCVCVTKVPFQMAKHVVDLKLQGMNNEIDARIQQGTQAGTSVCVCVCVCVRV